MNAFDAVVLLILLVSLIAGLAKGLVRELVSMIGVILGILLALVLAPVLAPRFESWIHHDTAAYAAAFMFCFVATLMALGLTLFLDTETPLLARSRLTPHLVRGGRILAPLLPEDIRRVFLERIDQLPVPSPPALEDPEPVTI
jgi:MFS family permease